MPRVERRLIWMDNFRGLAIFLVIFHHAVSIMSWRGEGANPLAVVVNDATAGFRMPGLILLSGMLVERSLRKGSRPYLLGKVRNILWPFVLWVLVTALLIERRVTWSTVQEIVTPAHGILWFLWFLFAFYVLYWLSRNLNPAAVAICSFALSTVLPNWHKADRLAHPFWLLRDRDFSRPAFGRSDNVAQEQVHFLRTLCRSTRGISTIRSNTRHQIQRVLRSPTTPHYCRGCQDMHVLGDLQTADQVPIFHWS